MKSSFDAIVNASQTGRFKSCPACKAQRPLDAKYCDCGYNFSDNGAEGNNHSSITPVTLTDIKIPFSKAVFLMVTWAIAAIPAIIIISLILAGIPLALTALGIALT